MKHVKFARTWRNRVNDTTVHEYAAGWSGVVADETAERAVNAEVLDGAPVSRSETPAKARTRAAAKPKAATSKVATKQQPAPAADLAPAEPETQA